MAVLTCFCVSVSNGAHRTGAHLALAIQRERIKTEHVVDVFRCIKMMRGQRPQFVGNVVSSIADAVVE